MRFFFGIDKAGISEGIQNEVNDVHSDYEKAVVRSHKYAI